MSAHPVHHSRSELHDLQHWARAVVARWAGSFPGQVRLLAPDEALLVAMDAQRLDDAVDALMNNARRYRARTVTLAITREPESVRIIVSDDGPADASPYDAGEFVLCIPTSTWSW